MSILSARSSERFSIFKHSLLQSDEFPLVEILDAQRIAAVFQEEQIEFGQADEDVFTPAITLWAMVSQFLFSGTGRSVKAAAGRVVSLWAQVAGRIVAQNAGNYCRAKTKIPVTAIRRITQSLAHEAELLTRQFDDLSIPLEADQAEDKICPAVIASIRSQPLTGRIINVDGFTIDAPDTPDNQAVYPQNPVQPEGLGFPILRCVGLISMITGMLIDLASAPYTGKGSGETALLRQLQGSLRRGDFLVADSYYCTYWLIALCLSLGVELVMKNHHKRDGHPLGAKRLNDSERTGSDRRRQGDRLERRGAASGRGALCVGKFPDVQLVQRRGPARLAVPHGRVEVTDGAASAAFRALHEVCATRNPVRSRASRTDRMRSLVARASSFHFNS